MMFADEKEIASVLDEGRALLAERLQPLSLVGADSGRGME
jgi:hypothetical protein